MQDNFKIEKNKNRIQSHLNSIIKASDNYKNELGFVRHSVFEDKINGGKLWVVEDLNGEYAGHIMFGGSPPLGIRIFQIFVAAEFRGKGIAQKLLKELTEFAEGMNCLYLRADVAEDLASALKFWQQQGFCFLKKRDEEKKSHRAVFIHHKTLSTPSLVPIRKLTLNLKQDKSPARSKLSYVLDLNTFFSLVKNRDNSAIIGEILRGAMAGEFRLYVTPEFIEELEKHEIDNDVILKLARSTLPVLPKKSDMELDALTDDLRKILFPNRSLSRKNAKNDLSDLRHLAYSIIHSANAFVTEEKAIIAAREAVIENYNLDILSPNDFQTNYFETTDNYALPVPISVAGGARIQVTSDVPFTQLSDFIRNQTGISESQKESILTPQVRGQNFNVCIFVNGEIFSTLTAKTQGLSHKEIEAFYISSSDFIDTRSTLLEYAVNMMLKTFQSKIYENLLLNILEHDVDLEDVLTGRGFGRVTEQYSNQIRFKKLLFPVIVNKSNWFEFREKLIEHAGVNLPIYIPQIKKNVSGEDVISVSKDGAELELDLFSLESFISPSCVLLANRSAVMLPIASGFSTQLLERQSNELPFPITEEAIIRSAKVFYRKPSHTGDLTSGRLVFFYESGLNGRGIIGSARVRNSEIMDADNAVKIYRRFGVLNENNINSYSKNGQTQVLTFDNFTPFRNPVPFKKLKEFGCGKASMVGPEKIDAGKVSLLMNFGHGLNSKDVIISILPEYVEKILKGKKTIELRKRSFPDIPNCRMWIYATAPISAIVGTAQVEEVFKGTPTEIWNKFNGRSGVSKEVFQQYYEACNDAYAIKIKNPVALKKKIPLQKLKELCDGFSAPQYFRYIDYSEKLYDALLDKLHTKQSK